MRATAELLLERYGIVTRETVLAEGIPGGFSTLYGELTNLETLGTARRGYFVEGLGGAQFALPAAIERLRALKGPGTPQGTGTPGATSTLKGADGLRAGEAARTLVLAATDPANPLGQPSHGRGGRTPRTPAARAASLAHTW